MASSLSLIFGLVGILLLILAIYLMFLTYQKVKAGDTKSAEASSLSAFIIAIIAGIGIILSWIFGFVSNVGAAAGSGSTPAPATTSSETALKALATL